MNGLHAVIPVKDLSQAKSRLSPWLTADQRRALMLAMLRDVLNVVTKCDTVERTFLLLSNEQDADFCLEEEVALLFEPNPLGLNGALHFAVSEIIDRGADSLLILPGDIPLLRSSDLKALVDALPQRLSEPSAGSVVIVPNKDHSGTNTMLCTPPGCLPFNYGQNSFVQHQQSAGHLGLECQTALLPNMALDVDTPEDLMQLAKLFADDATGATQLQNNTTIISAGYTQRLLLLPAWQEKLSAWRKTPPARLKQVYP